MEGGVFLGHGGFARTSSRRSAMTWSRVAGNLQGLAAHAFLLAFTLLIIAKVAPYFYVSWWYVAWILPLSVWVLPPIGVLFAFLFIDSSDVFELLVFRDLIN